jgi:hypothetical protein
MMFGSTGMQVIQYLPVVTRLLKETWNSCATSQEAGEAVPLSGALCFLQC